MSLPELTPPKKTAGPKETISDPVASDGQRPMSNDKVPARPTFSGAGNNGGSATSSGSGSAGEGSSVKSSNWPGGSMRDSATPSVGSQREELSLGGMNGPSGSKGPLTAGVGNKSKTASSSSSSSEGRGWVFWSLVVIAAVLTVAALSYFVWVYFVVPGDKGSAAAGKTKATAVANAPVKPEAVAAVRPVPVNERVPYPQQKQQQEGGYVPEKLPQASVAEPITQATTLKQRLFRTNKGLRLYPVGLDGRPVQVTSQPIIAAQ